MERGRPLLARVSSPTRPWLGLCAHSRTASGAVRHFENRDSLIEGKFQMSSDVPSALLIYNSPTILHFVLSISSVPKCGSRARYQPRATYIWLQTLFPAGLALRNTFSTWDIKTYSDPQKVRSFISTLFWDHELYFILIAEIPIWRLSLFPFLSSPYSLEFYIYSFKLTTAL